ncbi:reverse transcriptase domain-containing protein [Paenibacillus tepidiphilus]|uniref:reverse transcriptase domain-containing protein n=1 Tax=Paenibacillus tepidiphilus TaxID=2608683 RepID=UPI00123B7292|nr:reverse transcriptase domain-containing protein [Paenibacillus tepidiphilus]
MKEETNKYELIAPKVTYLRDIVVIAQAWKKTHKYIRRHNWYADTLELDCSTINLEENIKNWSKKSSFKPDAMKVVPAPKNAAWDFENSDSEAVNPWYPQKDENGKPSQGLRPLAHLNIKDQTLATTAMLCLADAIETAQGPSDEQDFLEAQRQLVFSYGNRLHCEWESVDDQRKKAKFSWGNSQSYRKFYEDYRLFLLRPKEICQYFAPKLKGNQNIFVVSMDIKGFFDNIDRQALLRKLKKICEDYSFEYKLGSDYYNQDDEFWTLLERIFTWKWEKSSEISELFEGDSLPEGIPQGLVASGFFSNAYLIGFDEQISKLINKKVSKKGKPYKLVLRDYCRYVDDLRLVIETTDVEDLDYSMVKEEISLLVEAELKKCMEELQASVKLEIKHTKTKIFPHKKMSTQSNVSSLMTLFQSVLSGTPDVDSLMHMAGGLDGLLQISDQLLIDQSNIKNILELSRISSPNIDVRDDTLKRFVATRLASSLRLRRGMTDLHDSLASKDEFLKNVTAGQMLDHEFETTARKLIACWASNPSLTLLLKSAFDLFPDKILLDVVLDALEFKLFSSTSEEDIFEVKTLEYVSAEIFRAGAVEIGFRDKINYPDSANISAFRKELGAFARRFLNRPRTPWYVMQQVLLYLASIGDAVALDDKKRAPQNCESYKILHQALQYEQIDSKKMVTNWFPISLIAQQLHPDDDRFAHWFVNLVNALPENEQKEVVLLLTLNRPDSLRKVLNTRSAQSQSWRSYVPKEIDFTSSKELNLLNNEKTPLLRIIQSSENHFSQENALLLLVYKILKYENIENILKKGLSVSSISVQCMDWEKIQNLNYKDKDYFELTIDDSQPSIVPYYTQPAWNDKKIPWLYSLGCIIRSCLTGEFDFTTSTFLTREDAPQRYRGLRSTWFSRRLGLANSPGGLNQYQDPISPWISELLIHLLQWPGIEVREELLEEFGKIKAPADLINIFFDRIRYQQKIFGKLTGTPVYEIPTISVEHSETNKFRVAIVQTLLPKSKDFDDKDPLNWTPSYRARHQAHIASVCNLVRLQLKAWCTAQQRKNASMVDLIVFPELSIHPDDIWILRRLSDATKASIFAGLTFVQDRTKKNIINQAIWILRSERRTGREFVEVRQGKQHMTKGELQLGITGFRPYQVLVEFKKGTESIRVAGAICYDSTDLALVADLRDVSDVFVVSALNKDVQTFDNLVGMLNYHMYQPVILANSGEFGGSTAQAPFAKHEKLISHIHGSNQVAISVFEMDPTLFKTIKKPVQTPELKTSPAGYNGRF